MFRPSRRKKQILPDQECEQILAQGSYGVLAVSGDDGYPYTVPLNYLYAEGKLFFHCGMQGHKLDGLRANDKVSFCVVGEDTLFPEKFTTNFRSVIAFGRARIIEDDAERLRTLRMLSEKYVPNDEPGFQHEIDTTFAHTCMVEITIEHLSGKEGSYLASQRRAENKDS